MTDRSAHDPFAPPPAAEVELTERAAEAFAPLSPSPRAIETLREENDRAFAGTDGAPLYPTTDASRERNEHADHVAFIASELEAGLARKGIDV